MLYKNLAEVYEELSATTKRLEKTTILSKFLHSLHEDDKDALYLLLGDIYPEWSDKKIGISSQLVIKALEKATGISNSEIVKKWKTLGDLGLVAEEITKHKKQNTLNSRVLTTEKVIDNLRKLPDLVGKGTVDKKLALITELLTSASAVEAKYLVRTLLGDLRIGIKESTIRDALAEAFTKEKTKENVSLIDDAINQSNDIALVFENLNKKGLNGLKNISFEIGKPMKAMLAQKAKNIHEGFEAVGKPAAVEYKYDGFRMIIHKNNTQVNIFTRRLENVTKQFPEVAEYVKKYVKGKTFVLDGEAVGFDKKTKVYKPFQEISQRIKRKYDIEKMQEELPVEINVFDILYYNGKSMINEPFEKRRKLVEKIISQQKYKIVEAKQIITDNEEQASAFYKEALKDNQEGVMMKNLTAPYKPGSRVGYMIKIKPEERELDLVITGGEYGTGKRFGGLTSFTLSCYDEKNKKFVELGKMSTGLKEKESKEGEEEVVTFTKLSNLLKSHITKEHGRVAEIKPKIIITVTYQELQRSPTYSSGFALRFPRFTALRPDKPLSEIATLKQVEEDYVRQQSKWKYR